MFLLRCFFACFVFFSVKSSAPKGGWLFAFWEMKPKWNSNVHGVLFLSATCDWMIVLQSLKFENFTTFLFPFALLITFLFLFVLLISGWFGDFVLFLLNYLEFICMVVVYHVHVFVRLELFYFFSFDFILITYMWL